MSLPGRPRANAGGVSTRRAQTGVDVTPLLGRHEEWVSTAAVRQAIGAWAYTLGAGERRPSGEDVRAAVGVASALQEMALERGRWRRGGEPTARDEAVAAPVPEDVAQLASRSGYAAREAASALTLLVNARAASRHSGATVATVSLADTVLMLAPTVARLDWAGARDRLMTVGASLAPAIAVLRELAVLGDGTKGGAELSPETHLSLRASVRELEDSSGFGRSTVSEALVALERARLVDVETRPGRTTRFRLRSAAFGHDDEPPRGASITHATALAPGTLAPGVERTLMVGATSTPSTRQPATPLGATSAGLAPAVLIGEFAGTPIYAPPGTPLVVEHDGAGGWTCRVGPFLKLGPARGTEP